ncbi:Tryptophan transporter TrpP [Clostridium sp. USBA 49]|uniref:tryptophan transporter n=1 Tax=Clostridium sp. USBA 49 TaxID=1881060 RepID=UPI0009999470|nr:tryptophan transporter [Clostridium sp. USBA 49]SKA79308.1 Tryptophan transporter TrpP [Clostridium sp. USBA 49]
MNLRKLTISSLLLAIGLILHQIVPPILFGMKPDFLLSMMFIAIALCDDYKTTLVIGLAAGILTALTTGFPMGQIPNIIDKIVTSNLIYFLFKFLDKKVNHQVEMAIISIVGTLISGTVFLGSALILFGLPGPFFSLMLGVVLPATIFNLVAVSILYNSAQVALKRIN